MQVSLLDDFIDEEVVDKQAVSVGVLVCYWESASGDVFLGLKTNGQDIVRIVPGVRAEFADPAQF